MGQLYQNKVEIDLLVRVGQLYKYKKVESYLIVRLGQLYKYKVEIDLLVRVGQL